MKDLKDRLIKENKFHNITDSINDYFFNLVDDPDDEQACIEAWKQTFDDIFVELSSNFENTEFNTALKEWYKQNEKKLI